MVWQTLKGAIKYFQLCRSFVFYNYLTLLSSAKAAIENIYTNKTLHTGVWPIGCSSPTLG